MPTTVYVSADSLDPAVPANEAAFSYGGTLPFGPPVQIDSLDGQQDSLLPATNTRTVFQFGTAIYKLLNRQQTFATIICKSTDSGATWTVLDAAHQPAFETGSGWFDLANSKVTVAYVDANGAAGNIHLIDFDLIAGLWGAPYAHVGPITGNPAGTSISIVKRSDGTYVIFYNISSGLGVGLPTGLNAVVYDPATFWGVPFDLGTNITTLTGWDSTQTRVQMQGFKVTVDSLGICHCFFNTTSNQVAPVIWGNRVFYQQLLLNNTLPTAANAFLDFPGQVAPFPAFPYNTQQLNAFSGPPMGNPVIVGNSILLPVAQRNDSVVDRFPHQLANLYIGTPVSAPVWTLLSPIGLPGTSIDPGAMINDNIQIQEAPCITFDGVTVSLVYSAQDDDGTNLARLRMTQTTDIVNFALGTWTGQTIFDLQTGPPAFNIPGQFLSGAGAFSPAGAPPPTFTGPVFIATQFLAVIPLPKPKKC
jgi:hypothetical protein